MKRVFLALVLTVVSANVLLAQQPVGTPTHRFAWDQEAPTLADAQAYTYKYYADGSTEGIALAGVQCSGATSPFICSAPVPAFTPGSHSVELTANNIAGESPKSAPFAFVFVVTPANPNNIRIVNSHPE